MNSFKRRPQNPSAVARSGAVDQVTHSTDPPLKQGMDEWRGGAQRAGLPAAKWFHTGKLSMQRLIKPLCTIAVPLQMRGLYACCDDLPRDRVPQSGAVVLPGWCTTRWACSCRVTALRPFAISCACTAATTQGGRSNDDVRTTGHWPRQLPCATHNRHKQHPPPLPLRTLRSTAQSSETQPASQE